MRPVVLLLPKHLFYLITGWEAADQSAMALESLDQVNPPPSNLNLSHSWPSLGKLFDPAQGQWRAPGLHPCSSIRPIGGKGHSETSVLSLLFGSFMKTIQKKSVLSKYAPLLCSPEALCEMLNQKDHLLNDVESFPLPLWPTPPEQGVSPQLLLGLWRAQCIPKAPIQPTAQGSRGTLETLF